MEKEVVLLSRKGCHLCQRAEDLVESYFPGCPVLDVDLNEERCRTYGTRVPVLVIEGKVVLEGFFEEEALKAIAQSITFQDRRHGHSNRE
jgi:glutaredoxin